MSERTFGSGNLHYNFTSKFDCSNVKHGYTGTPQGIRHVRLPPELDRRKQEVGKTPLGFACSPEQSQSGFLYEKVRKAEALAKLNRQLGRPRAAADLVDSVQRSVGRPAAATSSARARLAELNQWCREHRPTDAHTLAHKLSAAQRSLVYAEIDSIESGSWDSWKREQKSLALRVEERAPSTKPVASYWTSSGLSAGFTRRRENWSWLVRRYERRAVEWAAFDKEVRLTKAIHKLAPSEVGYLAKGKFSLLGEEDISIQSEYVGSSSLACEQSQGPRSPRVKREKIVNQKYIDWQNANLERRRRLLNASVEKKKSPVIFKKDDEGVFRPHSRRSFGSLAISWPSVLSAGEKLVSDVFGTSWVKAQTFAERSFALKSWFLCPKQGFDLVWTNGKVVFCENPSHEGISVQLHGKEICHLGSPRKERFSLRVPTPDFEKFTSSREFFEANNEKLIGDHYDIFQSFIDNIKHSTESTLLSSDTLMKRIAFRNSYWESCNAMFVYGLAVKYKTQYGCPTAKHYELDFRRLEQKIYFKQASVSPDKPAGLFFGLDNTFLFHAGVCDRCASDLEITEKIQIGSKSNFGVFGGSTLLQSQWLTAHRPNVFLTLGFGFTIGCVMKGRTIFFRGKHFSRPDHRAGREGLITTRQKELFWAIPKGQSLTFTMKGLVKAYLDKKDQDWQHWIAISIGKVKSVFDKFCSKFIFREDEPDFILVSDESAVGSQVEKIVERPVYVEVPTKLEVKTSNACVDTSDLPRPRQPLPERPRVVLPFAPPVETPVAGPSAIPPPPPPLPTEATVISAASPLVSLGDIKGVAKQNGDSWLTLPGVVGKGNRSTFKHSFSGDWNRRCSLRAYQAICSDQKRYDPSFREPGWSSDNLIVNPLETFEFPQRVPKVRSTVKFAPSVFVPDKMDMMKQEITRRRPLKRVPESEKHHIENFFVKPKEHADARDSTKSDIEENPGPTQNEDQLRVRHPSPVGYERLVRSHKRRGSQGSTSIIFTDGESPIDPSLMVVTSSTPDLSQKSFSVVDENSLHPEDYEDYSPLPEDEEYWTNDHEIPRGPELADIEVNPGPGESSKDKRKPSFSPDRGRLRSRSLSRLGDRILSATGLARKNDETDLQAKLGISSFTGFKIAERHPWNFFSDNYEFHYIVSHFPKDKNFRSGMPLPGWSSVGFSELQKSLDQVLGAKHSFSSGYTGQVTDELNKYFQLFNTEIPVSGSTVSAIAHIVKAKIDCPKQGAFGFELRPEEKTILLHWSDKGNDKVDRRLWWGINGHPMVHGGSTIDQNVSPLNLFEPKPSIPAYRSTSGNWTRFMRYNERNVEWSTVVEHDIDKISSTSSKEVLLAQDLVSIHSHFRAWAPMEHCMVAANLRLILDDLPQVTMFTFLNELFTRLGCDNGSPTNMCVLLEITMSNIRVSKMRESFVPCAGLVCKIQLPGCTRWRHLSPDLIEYTPFKFDPSCLDDIDEDFNEGGPISTIGNDKIWTENLLSQAVLRSNIYQRLVFGNHLKYEGQIYDQSALDRYPKNSLWTRDSFLGFSHIIRSVADSFWSDPSSSVEFVVNKILDLVKANYGCPRNEIILCVISSGELHWYQISTIHKFYSGFVIAVDLPGGFQYRHLSTAIPVSSSRVSISSFLREGGTYQDITQLVYDAQRSKDDHMIIGNWTNWLADTVDDTDQLVNQHVLDHLRDSRDWDLWDPLSLKQMVYDRLVSNGKTQRFSFFNNLLRDIKSEFGCPKNGFFCLTIDYHLNVVQLLVDKRKDTKIFGVFVNLACRGENHYFHLSSEESGGRWNSIKDNWKIAGSMAEIEFNIQYDLWIKDELDGSSRVGIFLPWYCGNPECPCDFTPRNPSTMSYSFGVFDSLKPRNDKILCENRKSSFLFWWKVYFFFKLLMAVYQEFFWPDLPSSSSNNTSGKSEFPPGGDGTDEFDPGESLLVGGFGTRGDIVPIQYYANLAGHFGVRTHFCKYGEHDHEALDALSRGEMYRLYPAFARMGNADSLGYKRVFLPHCEVERSKGLSYTFAPSENYIEPIRFVEDYSKVNYVNRTLAWFAARFCDVTSHDFRIGALKDCSLPRSLDGLKLLKGKKNTGKFEEGWCSGSANKDRIPEQVRNSLPAIPNGDHNDIFCNYKKIHMHGGAGTVQTAIACGAEPIIHDPTLDRKYHTMPTKEKDFKQHSVAPFMGWLISSGFKVNAPVEVKVVWYISYLWNQKWRILSDLILIIAKIYTILSYFWANWSFYFVLYLAVPALVWKSLYKTRSIASICKIILATMWEFPLFCVVDSKFSFVVNAWSARFSARRLIQDISNAVESHTELIFEPVERRIFADPSKGDEGRLIRFPFPLGHWSLRDKHTREIFEGVFTEAPVTIGSKFKFIRRQRDLKTGARLWPAPFNYGLANKLVSQEALPYGAGHNCTTLVRQVLFDRSLIYWSIVGTASLMIAVALSPPETLKAIIDWFNPGIRPEESKLYSLFGFAAGLENIPIEPDEVISECSTPESETIYEPEIDWSSEESFDSLISEIAQLENIMTGVSKDTLIDKEDLEEVSQRTLQRELERIKLPDDPMIVLENIPPYVKHTWAQIVDELHHGVSFIRQARIVDCFFAWLHTVEASIYDFIHPLFEVLTNLLRKAYEYSKDAFVLLFKNICHLIDHLWGLKPSTRVKTVWGLTGLYREGMLGVKARLAASIEFSEFTGRTTFEQDYKDLVGELQEFAERYGAKKRKTIGGPQHRPVGYSKPLMSESEAKLLGFDEGEYATDPVYEERIESYLREGTKQGGDGVFLAEKMEGLKAKSQHRYREKYPALTSEDRAISKEIAQALFDRFPEVYADCDIMPLGGVHQYIKKKYSPGTPFINMKSFKSRQAMFDAGFDKVMQKRAQKLFEDGTYKPQFYHAFVKSQVVDIQKCLPPELGGKLKDVRTVVSQDLASYYLDQVAQIERNKRINWESFGAGIGMPLNQSMATIFERMALAQKERGGRYVIMDGRAFDSLCKPLLFEVNANLWSLGYKDHPSGNGKNIASVIKASYDARQSAWILGVTEKELKSLCVAVPDEMVRQSIRKRGSKRFSFLEDYISPAQYSRMSDPEKRAFKRDFVPEEGKLLIGWSTDACPEKANQMGVYQYGDVSKAGEKFWENQTFLYRNHDFESLYEDLKAVAASDFSLLSNVHFKNRGGSTGGSDTSNVNTHAFKAGVIYAWMKTTGRPARDFFKYNDLANTSDDTIWQTGGTYGLNTVKDIEEFRTHAMSVGIDLEIETTKNINKVEYLSKFVRVPNKEDSDSLSLWRSQKIKTINRSRQQMGRSVLSKDELEGFKNPQFVVVQNPSAILLRRSAFRYYQSSVNKWRYTSIERGAGHANNTAFVPQLYQKFALEWIDDVNVLLQGENIHRKYALKTGQFGLPCVEQVDSRASQQQLSPRQEAFLTWLKGNMYPSYYRVLDTHMNIAKIDPDQHNRFLRKLEKGWRGWDEILKEGVDGLFHFTNSIPDEWSKKFQPGIPMLYVEAPFYTRNKYIEKFIYLSGLTRQTEDDLTFGEFSALVQESAYGACCDPYRFWEQLSKPEYKAKLFSEEKLKYQGLALWISIVYACTSFLELWITSIPIVGVLYKLYTWTFVGMTKVFGITNTLQWHSTGRSSREISRMMPRDMYMVSKRVCAFVVDLFPSDFGYIVMLPCLLLDLLPPFLEAIGKLWYIGTNVKQVNGPNSIGGDNKWSSYAEEYIDELRASTTGCAYVAAKTSTGKSSYFIAAIYAAKFRKGIKKMYLIEPRKILRDETVIPFNIPVQRLSRGVMRDERIDLYIMTYGHFLTRLHEVDEKNDVVFFDEFHEEQGEMILGLKQCKAPIFLLSATPIEMVELEGSPFLVPNIDRRHPITIHKVDDGMSIVDMVMEGVNRYPQLMHRAMVIVPSHKKVVQTIAALEYLKLGKVSELSSHQRSVDPDYNILVCTPYVQTGLDLKPPPLIAFDCGLDVVKDKGIWLKRPWTNRDINQQRIGRVGRLQPGVLFQPNSAGTGPKGVTYPAGHMFMHEVIAKHYKVPQLTPVSGCCSSDLPFLRLNNTLLDNKSKLRSVAVLHALALSGVEQPLWEKLYNKAITGQRLGEEYDFVDRVSTNGIWRGHKLLSYQAAYMNMMRRNVSQYSISNELKWALPLQPINGKWVELEVSPTIHMQNEEITLEEVQSEHVKMRRQIDKMRSAILTYGERLGTDSLSKAMTIMA